MKGYRALFVDCISRGGQVSETMERQYGKNEKCSCFPADLQSFEERHRDVALEVAMTVVHALFHAGRRDPGAFCQRPRLKHRRIKHGRKRSLETSLQVDASGCLKSEPASDVRDSGEGIR